MDKVSQNNSWQARVAEYLRQGYGVEDIAVFLDCDVQDVRNEVAILRSEGRLDGLYRANGA